MGYKTANVNWLKVSTKKANAGVEPGIEWPASSKYPIARKLYLYTAGQPTGEIKEYIEGSYRRAAKRLSRKRLRAIALTIVCPG